MSAIPGGEARHVPWVQQLRTRPEAIVIGAPAADAPRWHLRAELAEAWDAVRIEAAPSDTVRALKLNALQAFAPATLFPDDYTVKLRGIEILDESATIAAAGARDGSIFLIARRLRRPVRA